MCGYDTPDGLVSVANRNLILAAGRPRRWVAGVFPVSSPLAEHLIRAEQRDAADDHPHGGLQQKLHFSGDAAVYVDARGRLLFQAIDEESRKVQRCLRNSVSLRAVVEPFRYPIVRIKRVTPMPYTEAFRSLRRQAARRPVLPLAALSSSGGITA